MKINYEVWEALDTFYLRRMTMDNKPSDFKSWILKESFLDLEKARNYILSRITPKNYKIIQVTSQEIKFEEFK